MKTPKFMVFVALSVIGVATPVWSRTPDHPNGIASPFIQDGQFVSGAIEVPAPLAECCESEEDNSKQDNSNSPGLCRCLDSKCYVSNGHYYCLIKLNGNPIDCNAEGKVVRVMVDGNPKYFIVNCRKQ